MGLRREVHPAEVACPDGRVIQRCKVFVMSDRLMAWGEQDRRPVLLLDVVLTDAPPANRGTLRGSLECLAEDGVYWVNRGRGCGCGQTALKALGPPVSWTGEVVMA